MSIKYLILFVSWAIIPLLLCGCGDKNPVSQKKTTPARQKVASPSAPAKTKKVVETSVEKPAEKEFSYASVGRRDPFQALTTVQRPVLATLAASTPLQKFSLDQLQVIGVIWGKGEPTAMVTAPDGKSYILKKGIQAGKNNGTVIDINEEAIIVEEKFYDFSGDVKLSTQNIPLPKKEGAK